MLCVLITSMVPWRMLVALLMLTVWSVHQSICPSLSWLSLSLLSSMSCATCGSATLSLWSGGMTYGWMRPLQRLSVIRRARWAVPVLMNTRVKLGFICQATSDGALQKTWCLPIIKSKRNALVQTLPSLWSTESRMVRAQLWLNSLSSWWTGIHSARELKFTSKSISGKTQHSLTSSVHSSRAMTSQNPPNP